MKMIVYKQPGSYRQRIALIRKVSSGRWTLSVMFPKGRHVLAEYTSYDKCVDTADKLLLQDYPEKAVKEYRGIGTDLAPTGNDK